MINGGKQNVTVEKNYPGIPTSISPSIKNGFSIGSIVDEVEKEFDRRWEKTASQEQNQSINGDYIKCAAWNISHESCLDNYAVCASGGTPTPYKNPIQTSSRSYPMDVKITNSEFPQRITGINDLLIEKINNASNYMYFENCAFFDMDILQAVATSLRNHSNLKVYINTVYPRRQGNDSTIQTGQFFYTDIAQKRLLLDQLSYWESFSTNTGDIIQSSDLDSIESTNSRSSISFSLTEIDLLELGVECFFRRGRRSRSFRLANIVSVTPKATNRVFFTAPARFFSNLPQNNAQQLIDRANNYRALYIHSKLAIFDGNYALCGSANFTSRSLKRDGECSVGVNDAATVAAMAQDIFSHWDIPGGNVHNIPSWTQTFGNTRTEGIGLLSLSTSALNGAADSVEGFELLQSLVDSPAFLY